MSQEQPADRAMESILPAGPLEHAFRQRSLEDFKPWHLPRKQHVRRNQWGEALDRLIDVLPDRLLINYLCLPGEDLLDVQVLADVCMRKKRRLQYVGFDSSQAGAFRSIQRVAAEQILRQTDVVEDTSEVIPDGFASIARHDSIGNRRLRDRGSYDVVNLDMCDSFTTQPHAPNHDAVLELLNHQTHRRGDPWLLFLTTHAEVDRLQANELAVYDSQIRENIQRSSEFRDCMARMLSVGDRLEPDALCANLKERRNCDTGFSGRWLALAIGKWILHIMAADSPWRVDLLSVYCYRTGLLTDNAQQFAAEPPNLFSLAFRLEKVRQPRGDPAGLACTLAPTGRFDEPFLAHKMAMCVERNTLDVDAHLQSNDLVNKALVAECEALLSVRYYSPEAYRQFVKRLPRITYPSVATTS